jgi:coenzyme F420-0:L-glutamate ligase / coenzyme F420-1:gamma-L-glutamate ligase
MKRVEIIGIEGLGEVHAGDSVGRLIVAACARDGFDLFDNDIVVIAQKIISKAEGKVLRLDEISPSAQAKALSRELDKDASLVQVILNESRRVIRKGGRALIVETHHGFVCANAGVDCSNVGIGQAALLPQDPDLSANKIRSEIRQGCGAAPAVIISDSFGRPWRLGTVDVAVGIAGMKAVKDERGSKDPYGYELRAAVSAVADEVAAAAELAMGKKDGVPVVIVRGCEIEKEEGSVKELLRPESEDLFRHF